MIAIKLDIRNEFLDLFPDTSIDIKLENPLLGDAGRISPGSYSLPFELPGGKSSPKNEMLLFHPSVIENVESFVTKKASLIFNGVPFRKGKLSSSGQSRASITSHFLFGLSQLDESLKTAKLRDVVSTQITISNSEIRKRIYVKRKDAVAAYELIINGTTFSGVSIDDIANKINNAGSAAVSSSAQVPHAVVHNTAGIFAAPYLEINLVYYSFFDPGGGLPPSAIANPITDPNAPLHVTVTEPINYAVQSFDLDQYYDEFDSFLQTNMNDAAYHSALVRFPTFYNSKPYDNTTIKLSAICNGYEPGGIIRNKPYKPGTDWGVMNTNSLQPFAYLKAIFEKIAEYFEFTFEGDFIDDADFSSILLDSTTALDLVQNFIGETPFVFWRRGFNLAELVPDITVTEFLARLAARFNLGFVFSEQRRTVTVRYRERIALQNQYEEITPLCSPIAKIDDQRITGIALKIPADETDLYSYTETYNVEKPQDEIEIKCGRIQQVVGDSMKGVFIQGIGKAQKFGEKQNILRLFYYRGKVTTPDFNYPWAMPSPDDNQPVDIFFVYETYYRHWLRTVITRLIIDLEVAFPLRSLVDDFAWEKKYRFDRLNYLIKSISIKLSTHGVKVSAVQLYTMK